MECNVKRNDFYMCFIAHRRKSDEASQSIKSHLMGTATAASSFSKKIGLIECGEIMGLLHDLGNISGIPH